MTISTLSNVVEGVLLFLNLQCEHLSRSTLKQLRPSLTVAIDTLTQSSTSDASCKLQLRVLAFGLGAYFLDGVAFIKQICHLCPNLRLQSCNEEQPVMEVLCRRTGEPGRVTRYALEGWSGGATQEVEPVIQESMVTRPTDLHPAALLVKMVLSFEGDLKDAGRKLGKQLHLIHLLNPEVLLSLLVRDRHKNPIVRVAFETTSIKTSCRPPLLITSDNHYIKKRLDSRLAKLKLFKGDIQTLPDSLLLQDGRKVSLKLFSMVAVLPHLRLKKGKKIPINKLCQKIHIFVYGSHSLPLVLPESQPGFPLSLVADWDCYGLSLSPTGTHHMHTDDQVAAPSYVCDVTNTRQSSSQPPRHTLIMFLFLEDPSSTDKTQLSENIRWKQQMELVHRLRVELQGLIMSQSRKFHQATHSALNKIVCNYGSHSKAKSIMVTALPLLAEAVGSIVKHSTEEAFRESCLDTLQVDCVDSVGDSVEQRLWRIAKITLGITHPTDTTSKNPDEPTTPELALALQSDPAVPQTTQAGPSTIVTTPHTGNMLVDLSTPIPNRENTDHLPATRNDTTNSQNTQSLFGARISNKRRTYHERESNEEDSQVTCATEDDTCFDSLCEEGLNFEANSSHISRTENQPSLPIISGATLNIGVKDLSEYSVRAEIESQLSQPLLGATASPITNWFDKGSSNSEDSDEEMSISNFDELENCSEGDSFTEGMECGSGGDDDMTEYDELGLYHEYGRQTNAQLQHTANSTLIEKGWSIATNESTQFADEGSRTTAALPVHEAILEQVAGGSASDDEWDNLLACKSKESQHTPQANNKADDVMAEQLADHASKNTQDTLYRTTLDSHSSSVLDVDVNDFEWD